MSSAIEQINTLLDSLSFAEKLTLNEQIAGALRKEGGGVKPAAKGGKRSKKGSKNADAGSDSEGEAKPKRKAAAGTLAWTAFVKHIKETQPSAFVGVSKESDKLTVVKGIRAENMAAYDSFVAEWKEKYVAAEKSEASSVAEQAEAEQAEEAEEAVPAPVVVAAAKPKTAAEKLAELKAAKAAAASAAAPVPAAATPKKPVKTVKAEAPKKAAKATVAKATEEPQMDQIDIDGKMYWHDPGTHGLWEVTGKTFGEGSKWMGYFQPGNDEEPIRYTEAFGDE